MTDRNEQQQAGNCEGNPQEVDGAARGEKRHGQWSGELQGNGDTQWRGLQGHIEEEGHPPQGHAVDDHIAQCVCRHAYTPRAQDHQHDNAGENQAQGRGALCANDREHAFGQ
ncbi:hypothetical protein D3C76_1164900 [compost metagenome]